MGLCHDFGSQISEGCDHPMRAGSDSCTCEQCGVVCFGRFDACPSVWARGPHPVLLAPTTSAGGAPAVLEVRPAAAPEAPVPTTPTSAAPTPTASTPAAEPPSSDGAFDALRREVDGLRGALAQEQALIATLVANGRGGPEPDAEALRLVVEGAVRKAVRREAVALGDTVAALIEGLRSDVEELRQTVDEVAAAGSALPEEIGRRDIGNRKAFRATLNQELEPIIEVVAEAIAQSDYELQAIDTKLDALTDAIADLSSLVAAATDAEPVDEPPPLRSGLLGLGGSNGGSSTTRRQAQPRGTKVSLRQPAD